MSITQLVKKYNLKSSDIDTICDIIISGKINKSISEYFPTVDIVTINLLFKAYSKEMIGKKLSYINFMLAEYLDEERSIYLKQKQLLAMQSVQLIKNNHIQILNEIIQDIAIYEVEQKKQKRQKIHNKKRD